MKEIAAALIEAQKELPLVLGKDDQTVVGKTKGGDYVRRGYLTLEKIIEEVRPILSKHGIALVQTGDIFEGKALCRTRLIHSSGEFVEGAWPVLEAINKERHPSQLFGMGWTYARRYSLAAILGIGTGDQDVDAGEPPTEQEQQQEPTFREWFDGQIAHYRSVLGGDFDAEVKRLGINDLSAIAKRGEAMTLLDNLKSVVDKRAAQQ